MAIRYQNFTEERPVVLCREDMKALVALFQNSADERVEIEVLHKGTRRDMRMTTLEKRQGQAPLPGTDTLDLRVVVKRGDDDLCGATFEFYHNLIHYQLYAHDDTWCSKTDLKIRAFFKQKKPWYAGIKRIFPYSGSLAILIFGQRAFSSFSKGDMASTALMGGLTLIMSALFILESRGKICPHIWIRLEDKG